MVDSVNPYRSSVGFHMKTSNLICTGNQMNCFYMKDNTAWKWVQVAITKYFLRATVCWLEKFADREFCSLF